MRGGFKQLIQVQQQVFLFVFSRKDILAFAQTGTGKTASFALPVVEQLVAQPGR